MLEKLQLGCDVGEGSWLVSIDSTVVRAHHHAAGARGLPPADVAPDVLAVALAGDLAATIPPTDRASRSSSRSQGAGPNDTNPQLSQADHRVLIPAVVLAEVATGAPTDAAIWHVLGKIPRLDLPQGVAMWAGDAIVAATAVELAPSVVITADKSDLEILVDGFAVTISAV